MGIRITHVNILACSSVRIGSHSSPRFEEITEEEFNEELADESFEEFRLYTGFNVDEDDANGDWCREFGREAPTQLSAYATPAGTSPLATDE